MQIVQDTGDNSKSILFSFNKQDSQAGNPQGSYQLTFVVTNRFGLCSIGLKLAWAYFGIFIFD